MTLRPNDGDRPSRLQLGRFATGELDGDEAAEVKIHVASDPAGQAHLDAIEDARSDVPAFDFAALTARAAALEPTEDAAVTPAPANNNHAFLIAIPALLVAAIALLIVWPALQDDGRVTTLKGAGVLEVYHLMPEGLTRYDNRALGEGDVVGFKVDPATHRGVVLLSVDGAGQVSVFYPESGDRPMPVPADGVTALPGSIVLDDAPGPEVFVAIFDMPVGEARSAAERAWQSGGLDALQSWARANQADLEVVERK